MAVNTTKYDSDLVLKVQTGTDPGRRAAPGRGGRVLNWRYLVVHHTGAEEKDAEQVRRYHKSLGWVDTGYNFVIERNGLVVPGRSLEMRPD